MRLRLKQLNLAELHGGFSLDLRTSTRYKLPSVKNSEIRQAMTALLSYKIQE